MERTFFAGIIMLFLAVFTACIDTYIDDDEQKSSGTSSTGYVDSSDDALDGNCNTHESESDYTWEPASVVNITLNGTSATIDGAGATVDGSTVTITTAGNYSISGPLSNGQVIVNAGDSSLVRLILNGAEIASSSSAPIYVQTSDKTIIVLTESTSNSVTCKASAVSSDSDLPNAAVYSMSDLTICGSGALTVTSTNNDGITSKDGLIITSPSLDVTSGDDGIRGKDYLVIKSGTLTVKSGGDGLQSDNDEDDNKGYICISSGDIAITSTGDGLYAATDVLITGGNMAVTSGGGSNKTASSSVSSKGIKGVVNVIIDAGTIIVSSADDAIHSNGNVAINGGTFTLSSGDDGIHADASIELTNALLSVTKSYEGIESASITVNSGDIYVAASNDCFNASKGTVAGGTESNDGSALNVYGGTISVNMTGNGDGFDSNGNITMTAGTLIIQGPSSSPEVAFDYNGTFKISGGLMIGTGPNSGNMIQAPSTSSSQYSVLINNSSLGTNLLHIQDASGNELVTFKPNRSAYYMVFSSSVLEKGSTYYVYTGGSYSGGTTVNGYSAGGTYSGGSQLTSFTISSIITTVGSASGGNNRPGGW